MVWSTVPLSENREVRSTGSTDQCQLVTVGLHGHWENVKAVLNHWSIQADWSHALTGVRDGCVVDGILDLQR